MVEGSSNGKYVASAAEDSAAVPSLLCPHCGEPVPASEVGVGPFIACPHCGQEFALPADDEPEPLVVEPREETESQMDAMRVHELARARRATIRARSWLIVGMVGCVAIAGEMIRKAAVAVRALRSVSLRAVVFVVVAACAVGMAVFLARRALAISRELAKPLLQDPETPPDFSTLSDGSQHWKNLDQM